MTQLATLMLSLDIIDIDIDYSPKSIPGIRGFYDLLWLMMLLKNASQLGL